MRRSAASARSSLARLLLIGVQACACISIYQKNAWRSQASHTCLPASDNQCQPSAARLLCPRLTHDQYCPRKLPLPERGYLASASSLSVVPCGLTALQVAGDDASGKMGVCEFVHHRTTGAWTVVRERCVHIRRMLRYHIPCILAGHPSPALGRPPSRSRRDGCPTTKSLCEAVRDVQPKDSGLKQTISIVPFILQPSNVSTKFSP